MKTIIKALTLLAFAGTLACQTTAPANNAGNQTVNKPAVSNVQPETTPAANTSPAPTEKTSGTTLLTPTDAYKAAYAARQKKDVKELKRVMSKDALEFFKMMSEPDKSIDDALLEMTKAPQAATNESRNEKIDGDKATLEYPDTDGKWKTMDFVKEDGEWKLTMPKFDKSPAGTNEKK